MWIIIIHFLDGLLILHFRTAERHAGHVAHGTPEDTLPLIYFFVVATWLATSLHVGRCHRTTHVFAVGQSPNSKNNF
jgi:hypothetical protein